MATKTIKKGHPKLKHPTKAQKIKQEYNRRYREKIRLQKLEQTKLTRDYAKMERVPYSPFKLTKDMRKAVEFGEIETLKQLLMNSKSIENQISNLATDGDVTRLKRILFETTDSVDVNDYLKQITYAYRSKVQSKAEKVPTKEKKKDYTPEERKLLRQLQGVWDWMLQEIFDKLPTDTQNKLKTQLGITDSSEIRGFGWSKGLKGFTNGTAVIYIKSNSNGIYTEQTMQVVYLSDIRNTEKGELIV